jgi:enoyl-CoA hydratase/carnithine racemase
VSLADHILTPDDLAELRHDARPIGFIDLGSWQADSAIPQVPFPLIGLGATAHPLAEALDAIIEPPVSADAILDNVRKAPRAAAACAQLLRSIEHIPAPDALRLESLCYAMLQGSEEHARWLAAQPGPATPAPSNDSDCLRLDRDGNTLIARMDRPQSLNAIDRDMRDALYAAFEMALIDPDLRVIKLRAEGRAFSTGAELSEFGTTRDPATAHAIRMRTLPATLLCDLPCLFDVHAQGAAIGSGLEVAAFAQTFTASREAWFQLPEIAMGIIPGAGGCVSVPQRIGRSRAVLLMLSGRKLNAQQALEWGLIDAIEDRPARDEG